MNNLFEKISLTLVLLKIFYIYLCHYFDTNNKIAITHLCHLMVKDKVAEQHILGKHSNCSSFGVPMALLKSEFHSSYYSAVQGATGLSLYYVIAYQKVDEKHIKKISLTLILLKIFDIYFFCYLATNEKIAIAQLWHAIEPQTMYHLIAEQHISRKKNSNCNTFGVISPLLKVAKVAITNLSLGLSPQNKKKFKGIKIHKDN